jgi:hypothetical protein
MRYESLLKLRQELIIYIIPQIQIVQ